MKPGTKLKSAVCDAEVMVIRGAPEAVVECGGEPMAEQAPAARLPINPKFAEGTRIGKRYVDAGGKIELLCVKPGQGSLSIAGAALLIKDAKPLPSSD
jgi:hypothetical protein